MRVKLSENDADVSKKKVPKKERKKAEKHVHCLKKV